jgi:hypothetical protein
MVVNSLTIGFTGTMVDMFGYVLCKGMSNVAKPLAPEANT